MTRLRTLRPALAIHDARIAAPEPKRADPHYHTAAHQAWRRTVIARAGGRCQDPSCRTPHRIGIRLFADHMTELRDGGAATDLGNGRALCGACHTRKTAAERARRTARPT